MIQGLTPKLEEKEVLKQNCDRALPEWEEEKTENPLYP